MSGIDPTTFTASVLGSYGVGTGGGPRVLGQDGRVASEALSGYVQASSVDLSSGNWVALSDTISDIKVVTLAQVEGALLDNLTGKLGELKALVDGSLGVTEGTAEHDQLMADFDGLESEISTLIGQSAIKIKATIEVDPETDDFEVRNMGSYVQSLALTDKDGQTIDLAMIEVSQDDVLGGFHKRDGCPICEALSNYGPDQAVPYAESANYLSGSGSPTGDITSSAQLTSSTDTNTILMGPYWDDSSLSYSIYNQDNPVGYNYSQNAATVAGAVTADHNMWDYRTDVQLMFSRIADSSGLTFEEIVEDPATGTVGDIRVAFSDGFATDAPTAGAFAFGPYTDSPISGDVWWNDDDSDNYDLSSGTKGFQRGLHEIGHAIGLSHPHDGGSYDNSTLSGISESAKDNYRYSVMSYNQGGTGSSYLYDRNMAVDYTVSFNSSTNYATISYSASRVMPSTMMILDVEALEHLYGASTANSTDTTYDVSSFGDEFIRTITDSGGTDTIDASSGTGASIINLTAGSLSSINTKTQANLVTEIEDAIIAAAAATGVTLARSASAVQDRITYFENTYLPFYDTYAQPTTGGTSLYTGTDNLAIARTATIENAIGGSGADQITGNASNNKITGGQGNDTINGGDGTDEAIFSGRYSDYTITDNGDGTYSVTDSESGRDGTDTVSNVEIFRFSDQFYSVSSGTTAGDPAHRGGSGGSRKSNIYYASLNRVNLNGQVMKAHEVAALKKVLFSSPGKASKLIEEALASFANQKLSIDRLIATIGGLSLDQSSQTPNPPPGAHDRVAANAGSATALVQQIKAQILAEAQAALDSHASNTAEAVGAILG